MLELFNQEVTVFTRTYTPDSAGGNSVSYVELGYKWRVRISSLDAEYKEDQPGREYQGKIRIVGEVIDDVREGDRIEFNGVTYELMSVSEICGIGTIPGYLRSIAAVVEKEN